MSILDGHTSYDPAGMPNQVGSGFNGATGTIPVTPPAETKDSKLNPKKVARDLLASFAPAAPVVESAAEKERKRRVENWTKTVHTLAGTLDLLGAIDGDPVAAAAALKALNTVLTQGTKAIQALTDSKLAPEPKAPRAAKAAKVDEIASTDEVTVHPSAAAATAAVEAAPQSVSADDGNTGF